MIERIALVAAVTFAFASVGCSQSKSDGTAAGGSGSPKGAAAAAAKVDPWCGATPCPCKAGTERKSNDKLAGCDLTGPATIQGLPVQKSVTFNAEGYLVQFYLAKEAKIGPVLCKQDVMAQAHGPGLLESCYTNGTFTIDGISCKGNISMTKSGKLRRCQLAAPKAFGDLKLQAEDWLTVYESGKPERFEGSAVFEIQGRKCKGYFNYLYESGKLKKCEIAEDATLDGKDYKAGTAVCFNEQAKVADCAGMQFNTL
jgi:hypothetical protein